MVRLLPLAGAAALFAQAALGAVVPVRRTNHEENRHENNDRVEEYNNNRYQQQESNRYNNNYYQGNQDSNQYGQAETTEAAYEYETTTAERQQAHETTTVEEQQAYETTTAMEHETTTAMEHETTTVEEQSAEETSTMEHETTTAMAHETTTVEAQETSTYTYPQYGSGSYNQQGYNDCVAQCMAQFGAPPSTMTMEHQNAQETATGAIHTVMVAPTGAGLRYVPFAVNATVGDTIRYVWSTPANHTVTLSSALTVCNKSALADERSFASGVRSAAVEQQIFDVRVETEEPQFYYCSVARHCQNGMFGIINPGNNVGGANTVGVQMSSWMQSNPNLQAAYEYLKSNITDESALQWGMGMTLDGIPEDQMQNVATNVLITQALYGENPGMLEGNLGAANPDGSPIKMLGDLNVLLSANTGTPPTNLVVSTTAGAATETPSLTPVNATSGAIMGRSATSVWVAAFVGVVGWLLF